MLIKKSKTKLLQAKVIRFIKVYGPAIAFAGTIILIGRPFENHSKSEMSKHRSQLAVAFEFYPRPLRRRRNGLGLQGSRVKLQKENPKEQERARRRQKGKSQ